MLNTISLLPADPRKHILGMLTLADMLNCRRVCKRWKGCLDNFSFLESHFPKLDTIDLRKKMTPSQFLHLTCRYHNEKGPQAIVLRNFDMLMSPYMDKMPKFHTLKIKNSRITSSIIANLAERLISPARAIISYKIKDFNYRQDFADLLKSLVVKNLKFNHLKLRFKSYDVTELDIMRSFEHLVVQNQALHVPCSLDVSKQKWFGEHSLRALVEGGAKIHTLKVKDVSPLSLTYLVANDVFCSPLYLKTDINPLGNHFFLALLNKNIRLKFLYVTSQPMSNFSVSEDLWCKVFHEGLDENCSLKINYNSLTDRMLDALNSRKNFQRFVLKFNLQNQQTLSVKKISDLVSKCKIFQVTLSCHFSDQLSYPTIATIVNGFNRTIDKLVLRRTSHLPLTMTPLLIKKLAPNCKLKFKFIEDYFISLFEKVNIPYGQFIATSIWDDYTRQDMCSQFQASLRQCKIFKQDGLVEITSDILRQLSEGNVKKLDVTMCEETQSTLLTLLKSPFHFIRLKFLRFRAYDHKSLKEKIKKIRPYLTLVAQKRGNGW